MKTDALKPERSLQLENTRVALQHLAPSQLKQKYRLYRMLQKPSVMQWGTALLKLSLKWNLPVQWLVKPTLFKHFCGGESITESLKVVDQLDKAGIKTALDYALESGRSEAIFEKTKEKTFENIEYAADDTRIPFVSLKMSGLSARPLLRKLSAGAALNAHEKKTCDKVENRLHEIATLAEQKKVKIYIDAEESWIQEAIDRWVERLMHDYNKDNPIIFHTLQLYRWDKLNYLKKLVQWAENEQFYLGIKLVRGAYHEQELAYSRENNTPPVVHAHKDNTDRDFDSAMKLCLEHRDHISLCAATHNKNSVLYLTQLMEQAGIPNGEPRIAFSQLYGMADHISYNLAASGYNVVKYLPFGPVLEVIPYLIRRAEENTSMKGQINRELKYISMELERRKASGTG